MDESLILKPTRQIHILAHPLLDRTERVLDGLLATIHYLGSGSEVVRHPLYHGFVLLAVDVSVSSLGASAV